MGRRTRANRSANLGILLLPVILILAAGLGWKLLSELRLSKLSGHERYNFVLEQESPIVVSVDTKDKTATEVYIPNDVYLTVAEGYGDYRVKSVYHLGQLDNKAGRLLEETLTDLLGVPIDGFIKLPLNLTLSDDLRTHLFTKDVLTAKPQTDFPLIDLGRVAWEIKNLRFDKIKQVNLADMGVLSEIVLADGTSAQSVDLDRLSFLLQGDFEEQGIKVEDLKVEVLNAGSVAGLGAKVARILSAMGVDVISVGNEDLPVSGCEVRAQEKVLGSVTARRIATVLNCKILPKDGGRADITVVLRSLRPGE